MCKKRRLFFDKDATAAELRPTPQQRFALQDLCAWDERSQHSLNRPQRTRQPQKGRRDG